MPKENIAQTSWKYGEISPLLRGRIDTDAWKNGAETLENFVVTPQGGLLRRPGTEHMLSITADQVKLINFRSADDNSYIVQLIQGFDYAQILKNGALLKGPNGQRIENVVDNGSGVCRVTVTAHGLSSSPTTLLVQEVNGATGANGRYTATRIDENTLDLTGSVMGGLTYTGGGILYSDRLNGNVKKISNITYASNQIEVTTTTAHGYLVDEQIGIAGVRGFTGANGQWTVASITGIFTFKINYTGTVTAYTSGGGVTNGYCVIPTDRFSTATDITKTDHRQSADVMFLVNPSIRPQVISRFGENEWECRDFKQSDGPYLDRNNTHIRLTISGLSDTVTFEDTQPTATVAITGIANAAGLFRITSNAHGLANGNGVLISGVTNYPAANGYWYVANVAANTFDLAGSAFAGAGAVDGVWKRVVYFAAGDVGKFVQFKEDNLWKLARVSAYTSATKVTCDILGNLMLDIDPSIKITRKSAAAVAEPVARSVDGESVSESNYRPNQGYTPSQRGFGTTRLKTKKSKAGFDPDTGLSFAAGTITATHAGTFSPRDVGKYIRTTAGVWYGITAYGTTSGTTVTASAATRIGGANDTAERGLVYYNRSITATITASAPTSVNPKIFASTDVGRHIRLNFTGVSVWCEITGYTSETVVTVKFFQDVPVDTSDSTKISNSGVVEDWQLGAWSDAIGWPETVEIHEQRLIFGGNTYSPQTVWMSVSGDYWNFSPTEPDGAVLDDSAVTYTIASEEVNSIVWMMSAKVLLIGTLGSEWQARAATSISEPITPTNLSVTPQSSHGSQAGHKAQRIGNSVFFLQRSGTRLRKMSYDFNVDGFVSADVSIASEHLMRNGRAGVRLAFQTTPFQVLWIVLEDGSLASVTVNEDENQYSFAHHTLGAGGGAYSVSDVVAITKDDGTYSRIYLVVDRNSGSNVEVERIGEFWMPSGTAAISSLTTAYTDSYATRTLSASSTATPNTSVPNGATVQALINGTTYITGTVSGGVLALGGTCTGTCYIGYGFTTRLKMLPPEGGSAFGTSMVKTKRVSRVGVRHFNSYKFKHGPTDTNLIAHTIPGTTTNFFTGDDKFQLNSPYGLESGYVIQIDEPWPIGILAIAPELKTNE